MGKLRLSIPGPLNRSFVSTEIQAISSRKTLLGNSLGAVAVASVTMIAPLGRSFELTGTVRNLFDATYADPASDQHWQEAIPQNGRTLRAGLTWKFREK
jgi:outer membrane receptor protein involved in Fe transport